MRMPVPCLLFFSLSLAAQTPPSGPVLPPVPAEDPLFSDTGDAAIARRYFEWAWRESANGRTAEALAALERGADYGAASSDISFFLAQLRSVEGRSRLSVLEACRRALETNRWEQCRPDDARFLEARTLSELRYFEEALNVLERCDPERYETHYQKLLALRGLARFTGKEAPFIGAMTYTMDRFPRETDPVRLLFDYAARGESNDGLRPSIDLALRRLPVLISSDPELAYLAVPFIWNKEEARRQTAAYRAVRNPNPGSLPAALSLGLVDGERAVEELFAYRPESVPAARPRQAVLDRELIVAVNGLLRSEEERSYLRRNLLQFSGVITEDKDHDGIPESWTLYQNGMIREYRYDQYQTGEADLIITFVRGAPDRAEIVASDIPGGVFPLNGAEIKRALLRWEQYPAVLNTELEGKRYIPRPLDYFFMPVRFIPLVFGGPDYPEREPVFFTSRSLLSFAGILEQPSDEFSGGTERIELSGGIPVKSTVTVNGRVVSETEFHQGRPVLQYVDLDVDGRMETLRRFDPAEPYRVVSTKSDWDGDGIYEYIEEVQHDKTIIKSWDLNRDGMQETKSE